MGRDYKREYENRKRNGSDNLIGVHVDKQVAEDFTAKCDANNTTKNAVLKRYIERYTYDNFDN